MSQISFRFGRYATVSFALFLLSLGALWGLQHRQPVPPREQCSTPKSLQLQEKSEALLDSLLGEGRYELHLRLDLKTVGKEVKDFTPSEGVLESEQIKRERLGKGSCDIEERVQGQSKKDYANEVCSRNWVVGKRTMKKVIKETRVSSVHAVVVVDDEVWERVTLAHRALDALLGVDLERGDRSLFIRKF